MRRLSRYRQDGTPQVTVEAIALAVGPAPSPYADYFETCRRKRNVIDYTRSRVATVASKGTPIGAYDLLIAGQAKARKLTLVTHNTTEFTRVPGLKIEDGRSRRLACDF